MDSVIGQFLQHRDHLYQTRAGSRPSWVHRVGSVDRVQNLQGVKALQLLHAQEVIVGQVLVSATHSRLAR